MRILLMGEYSGVHCYLAAGLRQLGHGVCVLSDGNHWKNYPRDINLLRKSDSAWSGAAYVARLLATLPRLRGFDVVQVVGPSFLSLRPEKSLPVYRYLRAHNRKIFFGAFGTDHYYTHACLHTDLFRYSDYRTGNIRRDTAFNRMMEAECMYGGTAQANIEMAHTCNGVVACLWEYYLPYLPHFPDKTTFIPLPIDLREVTPRVRTLPERVNFFIGIQTARDEIKGTDVMYPVLKKLQSVYPERCTITEARDVPFARYKEMLTQADVQLDQLYSYTPSMNSLMAMAQGMVVVGGGEPENYEILNEHELRPIVNVLPDEQHIFRSLEQLVLHPERIPELSAQSIEYVRKHHDAVAVAKRYVDFWGQH